MEKDRKKVRALYVFEIAIGGYLVGIFVLQLWLVYVRCFMFEELLRLGSAFGLQLLVIGFWYYIMSRTGSF